MHLLLRQLTNAPPQKKAWVHWNYMSPTAPVKQNQPRRTMPTSGAAVVSARLRKGSQDVGLAQLTQSHKVHITEQRCIPATHGASQTRRKTLLSRSGRVRLQLGYCDGGYCDGGYCDVGCRNVGGRDVGDRGR